MSSSLCYPEASFFESRPTSEPFISGDTFRSICDHVLDRDYSSMKSNPVQTLFFDPENVRNGDLIFVDSDCLKLFFEEYHPRIQEKYILISHNHDHSVPGDFSSYLEDDKLYVWFGQNVTVVHPKLIPIPIGLSNKHWKHSAVHDEYIKLMSKKTGRSRNVKNLIYINFTVNTNEKLRKPVLELMIKKGFVINPIKGYMRYLNDLKNHCFVLSPPGNGIDCHRTWEALYMNSYPIVMSSAMDSIFQDLPVLIIQDWDEISIPFLQNKYEEMSQISYKYEKLYFPYWRELIKKHKDSILFEK